MDAGKDMSEEATAAVKKATSTRQRATKKATSEVSLLPLVAVKD